MHPPSAMHAFANPEAHKAPRSLRDFLVGAALFILFLVILALIVRIALG